MLRRFTTSISSGTLGNHSNIAARATGSQTAGLFVGRLRATWRDGPDRYEWISAYLESHRLWPFVRNVMLGVLLGMCCVTTSMHWSPAGPHGTVRTTIGAGVSLCCLAMTGIWLRSWPTRRLSAGFVIASSVCVAVACLIQQDPLAALVGSLSFTMLGCYAAVLHGPRVMVTAITVGVLAVVLVGHEVATSRHDAVLAISKAGLIAFVMVALPVALNVIMARLHHDAFASEVDPLCGVLNRRGLERAITRLHRLVGPPADHPLVVMVIDLDAFKMINDVHGHAAGDCALAAVGEALRLHARDDAVVARLGGEEFVVAGSWRVTDAVRLAENLRRAVELLPQGVKCSIGVASGRLPYRRDDVADHLHSLVAVADAAMYRAKATGGNKVACAAE